MDGGGGHHVEADPVALLDRGHRGVLAAPGERPDDREAGADPWDLGGEEGEAAGEHGNTSRGHSRLTRIAEGRCSGSAVLGARAREQLGDRGAGVGCAGRARPRSARRSPTSRPRAARSATAKPAAAESTVTSASAVAAPALSSTVVLRKSVKRTAQSGLEQRLQQRAHAVGALDREIRLREQLGRGFVGADRDAQRTREQAPLHERPQPAEGVEVGGVVPHVERGPQSEGLRGRGAGVVAVEQRGDTEALVELHGGAHLEHLAAPVDREALLLGARGDLPRGGRSGLLVGGAAPMEGGDCLLVLRAHAQALVGGGVDAGGEGAYALAPRGELGVELRAGGPRTQQLPAVVAHVGDRPDCDDLARGRCAAAADAAHEPVALGDLDQERTGGLGNVGVVGVAHDRGKRAVDVEQHGGAGGIGTQRLQCLHKRGGGGHDP